MQQASKLAGFISEAVPIVGECLASCHFVNGTKDAVAPLLGPVISHELTALGSIFGSSERQHNSGRDSEINNFLVKQQDVFNLIASIQTDINKNQSVIMDALADANEQSVVRAMETEIAGLRQVVSGVT